MSTFATTAVIKCGRCDVPLQGPSNPQPHDLLTCPNCGGQVEKQEAIKQVGELIKRDVGRDLRDILRKAGFK